MRYIKANLTRHWH